MAIEMDAKVHMKTILLIRMPMPQCRKLHHTVRIIVVAICSPAMQQCQMSNLCLTSQLHFIVVYEEYDDILQYGRQTKYRARLTENQKQKRNRQSMR